MVSFSEALAIVIEHAGRELPVETVPLVLAAGRILAQPIVAGQDIPPAANSAMDGFAVRAEDLATATIETPATLRVIGEASAGSVFTGTVGRGEAVRIMTGGLVPEGADAVIEVEATHEEDGLVHARRALRPGEAVRRAGEDIRAGATAIAPGKLLGAGDIGVLASLGVVNVPVRVKPKVAILSTGNEIVEAFRSPGPGQIRNSTGPALYAACAAAGAEPIDLGIASDTREELDEKLEEGLRYDILLTTGGVSAGAYDFVQQAFPALGVTVLFHKVEIRPGRPILFGIYGTEEHRTLVFGLPGNPVSTLVTFAQFVVPAIRRLLGCPAERLRLKARLAEDLRKTDAKRHFVRGLLESGPDGLTVRSAGNQSSGAMSSMSLANCLIVLPEGIHNPGTGDVVDVELQQW